MQYWAMSKSLPECPKVDGELSKLGSAANCRHNTNHRTSLPWTDSSATEKSGRTAGRPTDARKLLFSGSRKDAIVDHPSAVVTPQSIQAFKHKAPRATSHHATPPPDDQQTTENGPKCTSGHKRGWPHDHSPISPAKKRPAYNPTSTRLHVINGKLRDNPRAMSNVFFFASVYPVLHLSLCLSPFRLPRSLPPCLPLNSSPPRLRPPTGRATPLGNPWLTPGRAPGAGRSAPASRAGRPEGLYRAALPERAAGTCSLKVVVVVVVVIANAMTVVISIGILILGLDCCDRG